MRSILLAGLISISGTALAGALSPWYVGGNLGLNLDQTDRKSSSTDQPTYTTAIESRHLLIANLLVGYGKEFKPGYYFGGEFNVGHGLGGANYTYNSTTYQKYNKLNVGWTAGLHAKLGSVIKGKAMLYGLLGSSVAQFRVKNMVDYTKVERWRVSFDVGAGVSMRLTDSTDLDFRYMYQHYSKMSYDAPSNNLVTQTPINHLVLLGLNYHFD